MQIKIRLQYEENDPNSPILNNMLMNFGGTLLALHTCYDRVRDAQFVATFVNPTDKSAYPLMLGGFPPPDKLLL
ncbi:MAG: hypothetical protein ACK5JC_01200 [Bacteroidota bacterium]|jgi:hypothetical protein